MNEENEEMAVEGDAEVPAPAADHEEPRPDCGQRFKPSGFDFFEFFGKTPRGRNTPLNASFKFTVY
jgi:hypothetical protein